MQIVFIFSISIFILGLTYFKAYDDGFKDGIEYNSFKNGTATKTREDNNLSYVYQKLIHKNLKIHE